MSAEDFQRLSGLARRYGVTPQTLRREIEAGRLPAIRTPGGHFRAKLSDVAALFEGEDVAMRVELEDARV